MRAAIYALITLFLVSACGGGGKIYTDETGEETGASSSSLNRDFTERSPEEIQAAYDRYFEEPEMPESIKGARSRRNGERIYVRNLGPLAQVFNDSNKYQYAYAERLGIRPVSDVGGAYFTSRPLVEIKTNPFYVVDNLTHSVPFLVPEAATLLRDIGRNFIDSLGRRGGDGYRIIVTSVLRTPQSVKSLRRINRNATDSSTHKFGTTFDISYSRFSCADTTRALNNGDLKNLLAEVLYDLRQQNRCLVKYERKSPCFHITATR